MSYPARAEGLVNIINRFQTIKRIHLWKENSGKKFFTLFKKDFSNLLNDPLVGWGGYIFSVYGQREENKNVRTLFLLMGTSRYDWSKLIRFSKLCLYITVFI